MKFVTNWAKSKTVSFMQPRKRHSIGDFEDILASFDRGLGNEASLEVCPSRAPEPEWEAETEPDASHRLRHKSPLRRWLTTFSLPWPSGLGGLIGGFAQHPPEPYAEEVAEAQSALPPPSSKPEVASVEPPKTENQTIADELGLSPELATIDLQRIRRDFAKKNHPDRFEPGSRTNAARRMSIANMLIDEQMQQSRKVHARTGGIPE